MTRADTIAIHVDTAGRPLNVGTCGWHVEAQSMKIRDLLALVEADGWREVRFKGSHRQFRHPGKAGVVTIAGHPGADVAPGTLNNVLKQASLKK